MAHSYPFRLSKRKTTARPHKYKGVCLRGRSRPARRIPLPQPADPIRFGEFCEEDLLPRRRSPRLLLELRAILRLFSARTRRLLHRLNRPSHTLPALSGALCAALLVLLISGLLIPIGLFSHVRQSYGTRTVPDLVGRTEEELTALFGEEFHFIIQYEKNPEIPEGCVISQTPVAGSARRLTRKDQRLTLRLTVSEKREPLILPALSGEKLRDVELLLRNSGIHALTEEEYSDSVARGEVIATVPAEGTALFAGDSVRLRVSAGRRQLPVRVPDLYGRTESQATSLLIGAGLKVGSVSYCSSSLPAGTVIGQNVPPHGSLPEGETVSLTVSLGEQHRLPSVPDLYGMTLSQASDALRAVGLVIGEQYPLASAVTRGTVLAQVPPAGTPITSSTVSVELYVSS